MTRTFLRLEELEQRDVPSATALAPALCVPSTIGGLAVPTVNAPVAVSTPTTLCLPGAVGAPVGGLVGTLNAPVLTAPVGGLAVPLCVPAGGLAAPVLGTLASGLGAPAVNAPVGGLAVPVSAFSAGGLGTLCVPAGGLGAPVLGTLAGGLAAPVAPVAPASAGALTTVQDLNLHTTDAIFTNFNSFSVPTAAILTTPAFGAPANGVL